MDLIPTHWRCYRKHPRQVFITKTTQMSRSFRPGKRNAGLVQRVLNQVEPWLPGEDPIEARELHGVRFTPETVRIDRNNTDITWAMHTGHTEERPGLSPFVQLTNEPVTNVLTVLLTGLADQPVIEQVSPTCPDEWYIPPLPSDPRAENADGGIEFCIEYWRSHAYIARRSARYRLMVPPTRTKTPPDWWHR